MFLIHERKFANTHKELFKQCVQDIPAIRKAKYPLVIDREQAMINAIEAKLPLFRDCSVRCVPYFSRRNRSVPFRILVTTLISGTVLKKFPLHWIVVDGREMASKAVSNAPSVEDQGTY